MSVLVNLLGVVLIGFIIWWFWLAKRKQPIAEEQGMIKIIVEGGSYSPSSVQVKSGETVKMSFLRKDPSPCAEQVVFADLGISQDLPLEKETTIKLDPLQAGEYEFTCQMGMYRGHLICK